MITTAPTNPYPDLAPPTGTDPDIWEGDPAQRVVTGITRGIGGHGIPVWTGTVHYVDGSLREPEVHVECLDDDEMTGLRATKPGNSLRHRSRPPTTSTGGQRDDHHRAASRHRRRRTSNIEHHGYHVTWCTNRDDEFDMHSEGEPDCSHQVTKVSVIPEGDVVKCQAWINATHPFTHGQFTPAQLEEMKRIYDGVEITLETWRGAGTNWDGQPIRLTSDTARSLAAALVRAADIEQGLT